MTTQIISTALVGAAFLAISVAPGWAGCMKPPASDQAISQFRANPQGLVAPNSDTRTIEATTRDLAGTDASLAADLIRVAEGTNPRFQTAIAAGLGNEFGRQRDNCQSEHGRTGEHDTQRRRRFRACPAFGPGPHHRQYQWRLNNYGRCGKPDTLKSFSGQTTLPKLAKASFRNCE